MRNSKLEEHRIHKKTMVPPFIDAFGDLLKKIIGITIPPSTPKRNNFF